MTFESGRQRQDVWSKKTWEAPGKDAGAGELHYVSEEQANEKQAKNKAHVLTNGAQGGIIGTSHKMAASNQQPPDFSKYKVKIDLEAVQAVKKMMIEELGIPEDKIDLSGIKNADVLEPFMKRWKRIQKETGMSFPGVQAVEIIDGDVTCVAGVPRSADRFYISSKYFNSKEALIDTLKNWTDNNLFPKQCKSIAFIAEHEAAHIRIPDDLLKTPEAIKLWKRRKMTNDNDAKINEYYADVVAVFRLSPNTNDKVILDAVSFLRNGGVSV